MVAMQRQQPNLLREMDRRNQISETSPCEWCGGTGLITVFWYEGEYTDVPYRDVFRYRQDIPWKYEAVRHCPCAIAARITRILDRVFGDVGPRAAYRDFTFETWDALPAAWRKGKEKARHLAGLMAQGPFEFEGRKRLGLIFSGPTGTTKSGLSTCILREWALRGIGTAWMDFSALIGAVKDTYDEASEYRTTSVIQAAIDAPLLLLDDVGPGRGVKMNEHTRDILWQVFNGRYASLASSIITINMDWPTFEREMDPALAHRLTQLYEWVEVGGADLRVEV